MLVSVANSQAITDVPTDYDVVTMGINPSKSYVHQGHHLTMFQAAHLLHKQPNAQGIFFVDDREFDLRKTQDCRYKDIGLPSQAIVSSIRTAMMEILQGAATFLHDSTLASRVNIQPMSQYMLEQAEEGTSKGKELYQSLYNNRRDIRNIMGLSCRPAKQLLARPTCNVCEKTYLSPKQTSLEEDCINGFCLNDDCQNANFSVDVATSNGYFLHYTIDSLRDVFLHKRYGGVAHVFGGDYGTPWGNAARHPKAQRLQDIAQKLSPDVLLHHYVGPILMKDGYKLSKSRGDLAGDSGIDYDQLQEIIDLGGAIFDVGQR